MATYPWLHIHGYIKIGLYMCVCIDCFLNPPSTSRLGSSPRFQGFEDRAQGGPQGFDRAQDGPQGFQGFEGFEDRFEDRFEDHFEDRAEDHFEDRTEDRRPQDQGVRVEWPFRWQKRRLVETGVDQGQKGTEWFHRRR